MMNLDYNVRTSVSCWTDTSGEERHASSDSVKFLLTRHVNSGS